MSLLFTFMDLDKLYESSEQPDWLERKALIRNIKASGKYYNFDNYSDSQLYRIWERIQKENTQKAIEQEYLGSATTSLPNTCFECGTQLSDGGICPVCDDGEEDY